MFSPCKFLNTTWKYRVIKKSLCTWRLQYRKLQVMFKASPASLQTFIMVGDWNCLKYCIFACFFFYCNRQVHRDFWSPCSISRDERRNRSINISSHLNKLTTTNNRICLLPRFDQDWPPWGSSCNQKGINDTQRLASSDYSSSSVICQTTGPKPLPKRFLHLMRSRE